MRWSRGSIATPSVDHTSIQLTIHLGDRPDLPLIEPIGASDPVNGYRASIE
jgi:hypothetical protein